MSKVRLTIDVPKWVITTVNTAKYAAKSVKWIFNPIKCSVCNLTMPTQYVETTLAGWSMSNRSKVTTCQHCVADKLKTATLGIFGEKDGEFDIAEKCDRCHSTKLSKKFYSDSEGFVDTRTCHRSWNSSYLCIDCAVTIMREGEMTSSLVKLVNKNKMLHINSRGLFFVGNKVKLFGIIR